MKITVFVKPNSKIESLTVKEDGSILARVNASPIDGKANERVIKLLSIHLNKPKSSIQLLHGFSGKKKIFFIS